MEKYHWKTLGFTYIATAVFSDFCYNQSPYEPVEWQLGVQDAERLQQYLDRLRKESSFVDLLEPRHWQVMPALG